MSYPTVTMTRLDRAVEGLDANRRHLAALWICGVRNAVYGDRAVSNGAEVHQPRPDETPSEFVVRVTGNDLDDRCFDPLSSIEWETRGGVTFSRGSRILWGVGFLIHGTCDVLRGRRLIQELLDCGDDIVVFDGGLARRTGSTWLVTLTDDCSSDGGCTA